MKGCANAARPCVRLLASDGGPDVRERDPTKPGTMSSHNHNSGAWGVQKGQTRQPGGDLAVHVDNCQDPAGGCRTPLPKHSACLQARTLKHIDLRDMSAFCSQQDQGCIPHERHRAFDSVQSAKPGMNTSKGAAEPSSKPQSAARGHQMAALNRECLSGCQSQLQLAHERCKGTLRT